MPKRAKKVVKKPVQAAPHPNHRSAHLFLILTALLLTALLVVAILLRFSPPAPENPPSEDLGGFCGTSIESPCSSDSDCLIGGCSAQVCGALGDDAVTTCEYRDCYDRAKYGVACGCVAQKCAWKK